MKIHTEFLIKKGGDKILAVSLFRMKSAYRSFEKYLTHAKQFITLAKKMLPDWTIRFYTDDSVPEITQLDAEIVKYRCDEFWDSESSTHEGVFGTFMRFLPLFESHEIVAVSDIDTAKTVLNSIQYLEQHSKEFGCLNVSCNSGWAPLDHKFNILAGGMVSKIKFPKQLLTNFLTKIKSGKVEVHAVKKTDVDTILPYSADEVFLNTVFYEYLIKHNIHTTTYTLSSIRIPVQFVTKPSPKRDSVKREIDEIEEVNYQMWKDNTTVKDNAYVKPLRKIMNVFKEEIQESGYLSCLESYLRNPSIVTIHTY